MLLFKVCTSLSVEKVSSEATVRAPFKAEKDEKREKEEKHEKREKEEKFEKRESSFIGPLIGGLFLILLGFMFYLAVTASLRWEAVGAFFFVILGIIIIVGGVVATRRHPQT